MNGDAYDLIANAACKVAKELPLATAQLATRIVGECATLDDALRHIGTLPHPHYRAMMAWFIATCRNAAPSTSPAIVAMALLTAARSDRQHRDEQVVELVWTGPDTIAPFRRTEQAILQVLDSAQQRITLVSYAVYCIPHVRDALVRAARRGVRINVVVETPDRLEGENEYNTLRALGSDVAACSAVYYWPKRNRPLHASGKPGILHVKCVVADGHWLLLSSANLTEQAFTINAELGVLVAGGDLPVRVELHFDQLIASGVWETV